MPRPYAANIPPRRIRFKRQADERYWHHGCKYHTYHFNALNLLTPIFENMVVASIRKVHKKIKDNRLKLEVNSLILQEANHSGEFVRFNKDLVYPYYGKDILSNRLKIFRGVIGLMPQSCQLAASAFGEHLATVSSEFLLEDARWLDGVPKDYADIYRWHSIEEIEHKHVAFDVYRYFHTNYFVRTMTMGLFLVLFLYQYFSLINRMMKQDKTSRVIGFFKLSKLYWIKPGFFRQFLLPFIGYLKPFFHPNDRANIKIADKHRHILSAYLNA